MPYIIDNYYGKHLKKGWNLELNLLISVCCNRARRFPLPDGPGQVKLPVGQVDLDRFFFFISYKQIEEFQNSCSWASDDFEKRRALCKKWHYKQSVISWVVLFGTVGGLTLRIISVSLIIHPFNSYLIVCVFLGWFHMNSHINEPLGSRIYLKNFASGHAKSPALFIFLQNVKQMSNFMTNAILKSYEKIPITNGDWYFLMSHQKIPIPIVTFIVVVLVFSVLSIVSVCIFGFTLVQLY